MISASRAVAGRLDARALLWLGGLASGLVVARAALRGIHVPGHTALPTLFALVAGVAVARRAAGQGSGAACAVAAPALVASSLGLGAGGALTLLLAAFAVEVASFAAPRFVTSVAACAALGAAAGALRFVPDLPALLAGAPDPGAPALLSLAAHAGFGALGAALVPLLGVGRQR